MNGAAERTSTTVEGTSASVLWDYLRLAKARSIVPHLITATAAMFLAAGGSPPLHLLLPTLVGGGSVAAASNAFNCYLDRELDARMARTRLRPLPAGRMAPRQALLFGIVTSAVGLLTLGRLVGLLAATLALAALVYYVFAYTLFFKRRAPWNVLIGSGAGALTPLIGWVAVTDRLTATPFLLSAIIIVWTLPHFWALAVFRRRDYAQAGIKVLPSSGVTAATITCSVILVVVSLMLAPVAGLGLFYLVAAGVLGAGFIYLALQMRPRARSQRGRNRGPYTSVARHFYAYSIVYITLLFLVIIASEAPSRGVGP